MTWKIDGTRMDGSEPVQSGLAPTALAIGTPLLVVAGWLAWGEIDFIRNTIATEGRVVDMRTISSRDSSGQTVHGSTTSAPVFTFRTPDGREMRVVSPVSSNPPCCSVGDDIRVRFPPDAPEQARIVSLQDSWLWPGALTLFGAMWVWPGLAALRAAWLYRRNLSAGRITAPPPTTPRRRHKRGRQRIPVRLAGLRREDTPDGPRWILQARWEGLVDGSPRLFEGEPLPFDPAPQMRGALVVQVTFDPDVPNSPYAMDLSFLPGMAKGPDRRA